MNSTLTPLNNGYPLNKLNLSDEQTQFSILSYDKHQTLEGLQIEPLAMTYIDHLRPLGIEAPDVETLIAKQRGSGLARCIFIWDREFSETSKKYIQSLSKLAPRSTYIIEYCEHSQDFYCRKLESTQRYLLQDYLRRKRKTSDITFPTIAQNVRDTKRQMAVFWGRLNNAFHFPEQFQKEVVLNRILKNFVVQPFFTWLWDLDRIIRYRDVFWEVELKHKFPYADRQGTLQFGLNVGQANLVRDLGEQGIKTLHLIMVKPIWDKTVNPGYLYNRRDLSENVLIIGAEITTGKARQMLAQKKKTSDASTSYSGKQTNNFLTMAATDFYLLGTYQTMPRDLAKNIKCLLDGTVDSLTQVTDKLLLDNKQG